jgi:hypothetical protein
LRFWHYGHVARKRARRLGVAASDNSFASDTSKLTNLRSDREFYGRRSMGLFVVPICGNHPDLPSPLGACSFS